MTILKPPHHQFSKFIDIHGIWLYMNKAIKPIIIHMLLCIQNMFYNYWVRDFAVWQIWSGRFGLSRFCLGRFGHGTFLSGRFGVGTFLLINN